MRNGNPWAPMIFISVVISVASVASAEQVVLQPGPDDGLDTWITPSGDSGDNPGSSGYLHFGSRMLYGPMYSLLQFDLSSLDETSSIVSAQLELYKNSQGGSGDWGSMSVMKIVEAWSEDSTTWFNQPAFDPIAITDFPGDTWAGGVGWHAITDLEGLVQFWIENPDQNFGLLIKPTTTYTVRFLGLRSSDYGTSSLRPKLVIDGTIVPVEEASWSGVKSMY